MSRIEQRFAALRSQGRCALIPYIAAGDPEPNITVPLMHALVRAGADIIELGVPFSDPMADGPVIQRAAERALEHGISLHQVLDMVRAFRTQDVTTPIVLMGYLNPVEVMGYEPFAAAAAAAGVDGVLTVDLPPEEAGSLKATLAKHKLDAIYLLAPTSPPARMRLIAGAASGFIYYVSLRGVTGASHLNVEEVAERLAAIRTHTRLPLGVGFGIGTPEAAAAMAKIADAVIVGSAIVRRMEDLVTQADRILTEVPGFLSGLRAAMDQATVVAQASRGANR
ncbi:MAG: tryptophan synthase subunit alpha [Pseudomonadota bacterium]|nr:MAG: tryptophan synthase subunit alpha [Pseudomonadota bacterium]